MGQGNSTEQEPDERMYFKCEISKINIPGGEKHCIQMNELVNEAERISRDMYRLERNALLSSGVINLKSYNYLDFAMVILWSLSASAEGQVEKICELKEEAPYI